jgi:tetratricopeptide (TPR) repeat protein
VQRLADALDLSVDHRQQFVASVGRRLAGTEVSSVTAAPHDRLPGVSHGHIVPRQLPAPVLHFVGHEAELAALDDMLDRAGTGISAGMTIAAIDGSAGVGKTALAVQWAHQVADRFPDGQLYVNLHGFDPAAERMSTAAAICAILAALEVSAENLPLSLDAQASLYRSLLAGKRMLVILDNAGDVSQVRPLLPGSPSCLVVITSRSQLTGLVAIEDAQSLSLGLLSDSEARRLLAARLGAGRVDAEQAATAELIRLCARLPLALVIAAARLANRRPRTQLSTFVQELKEARSRLDLLDCGDASASLRAVFSWSVASLPAPAARMFGLLGLHPGRDITPPAAASLAAVPIWQARTALQQLASANLVTEHSHGRFGLHDLLRAYVVDQASAAGSQGGNQEAVRRILDFYLRAARSAARVISPRRRHVSLSPAKPRCGVVEFSDYGSALRWLESERANLVAMVAFAADQGEHEIAWKLPIELWDLFSLGYYWSDWIKSTKRGLVSARELGDTAAQAWLLNHLATAHHLSGDTQGAIDAFRQALDIRELIGDRYGRAVVLANLGRALSEVHRLAESTQCLQQALQIFTETEHLAEKSRCLYLLSATYRRLGRTGDAIASADQAVRIIRRIGDDANEGSALVQLSLAFLRAGNHASAIAHARRAAELAERRDDRADKAEALATLGHAFFASGQSEQARQAHERARAIFTDIGHPNTAEWLTAPP